MSIENYVCKIEPRWSRTFSKNMPERKDEFDKHGIVLLASVEFNLFESSKLYHISGTTTIITKHFYESNPTKLNYIDIRIIGDSKLSIKKAKKRLEEMGGEYLPK